MTPDLPPPAVEVHGDLRLRADTEQEGSARLRAHPEVKVGQEIELHALGDLRASTTERKLHAVGVGAWAIARTPVGELSVGRIPMPHWGLGLVAQPGGCLNCVRDMAVDRVSFATELGGHVLGIAGDVDRGGIRTSTLTVGRLPTDLQRKRFLDEGHSIWGYGLWSSWRTRSRDALRIGLVDGWLRYEAGQGRVEVEGVFAGGRIDDVDTGLAGVRVPPVYVQQSGGAMQLAWGPVQVETGFATGDRAPGRGVDDPTSQVDPPHDQVWTNFVVNENHFVDRLQFRRRVGAVTDAAWIHPSFTVSPDERLELRGWFTWSRSLVDDDPLAPEMGATVRWNAWQQLHVRVDAAVLVGDGGIVEGNLAWLY